MNDHDLVRSCHQREQCQEIERKQGNGDVLRDHAEERGRDTKTDVGERHLYADHGLRFVSAEDVGRHMDDAGIDGRATETDDDKADQCEDRG